MCSVHPFSARPREGLAERLATVARLSGDGRVRSGPPLGRPPPSPERQTGLRLFSVVSGRPGNARCQAGLAAVTVVWTPNWLATAIQKLNCFRDRARRALRSPAVASFWADSSPCSAVNRAATLVAYTRRDTDCSCFISKAPRLETRYRAVSTETGHDSS